MNAVGLFISGGHLSDLIFRCLQLCWTSCQVLRVRRAVVRLVVVVRWMCRQSTVSNVNRNCQGCDVDHKKFKVRSRQKMWNYLLLVDALHLGSRISRHYLLQMWNVVKRVLATGMVINGTPHCTDNLLLGVANMKPAPSGKQAGYAAWSRAVLSCRLMQ